MNGGLDGDDCMTPPPAGQGADDSDALPLVGAHHFVRLMEEVQPHATCIAAGPLQSCCG